MLVHYHAPPWYQDPNLTGSFLAGLTREITQIPFGTRWPDAVPVRTHCASYVGGYDDLFKIRYWVYACNSRREGAIRTDYMYILDGDETPTLERVRYVIVAPPDARVEDWGKIQAALLNDLSAALEIPKWRNRDWEKIGVGRDRVVEAELFHHATGHGQGVYYVVEPHDSELSDGGLHGPMGLQPQPGRGSRGNAPDGGK